MRYITNDETETEKLGAALARAINGNEFIALRGELGAGKTAFARGFVRELGAAASSPTFTIAHEYDTHPKVFHFDMYRVKSADELDDIGFDDYFKRDGIILMEWPENIESVLPFERIDVTLTTIDETKREVVIESRGVQLHAYENLVRE